MVSSKGKSAGIAVISLDLAWIWHPFSPVSALSVLNPLDKGMLKHLWVNAIDLFLDAVYPTQATKLRCGWIRTDKKRLLKQ